MYFRNIPFTLLVTLAVYKVGYAETGPLGYGAMDFKEELESDRPDFTEGALTVEPGHLQIESGYTYVESGRESSHTFPELLVRVGLAESLELRLGWPGYSIGTELDEHETRNFKGALETSVGFKHRLLQGETVDLSWIGEIALPAGREGRGSEVVEPGIKFLWATELTDDLSLAGNLNLANVEPGEDRYFESAASIAIGFPLYEDLSGYLEYFGIYPWEEDDDSHYASCGVTYLINSNLQIDVRVGTGLTTESEDLFVGSGLVFRL